MKEEVTIGKGAPRETSTLPLSGRCGADPMYAGIDRTPLRTLLQHAPSGRDYLLLNLFTVRAREVAQGAFHHPPRSHATYVLLILRRGFRIEHVHDHADVLVHLLAGFHALGRPLDDGAVRAGGDASRPLPAEGLFGAEVPGERFVGFEFQIRQHADPADARPVLRVITSVLWPIHPSPANIAATFRCIVTVGMHLAPNSSSIRLENLHARVSTRL